MEWTRKEVLDFVDFYKQRTILWDPRHPDFYNRADKGTAWSEVAQDMGKPLEECKRKMDYLLAALRREKQKIKKTIGVGKEAYDLYKSRWYAFDSLRFLLDKRDSLNYIKIEGDVFEGSEEDAEEAMHDIVIPDLDSNVESTSIMSVAMPATVAVPMAVPVNPRKRRANNAFDDRFGFDSPIEMVRTTHDDSNDDCEIFGNLIAAKLRKFNEDTKTCLQIQILSLFVKASRGAYNANQSEQSSDTH